MLARAAAVVGRGCGCGSGGKRSEVCRGARGRSQLDADLAGRWRGAARVTAVVAFDPGGRWWFEFGGRGKKAARFRCARPCQDFVVPYLWRTAAVLQLYSYCKWHLYRSTARKCKRNAWRGRGNTFAMFEWATCPSAVCSSRQSGNSAVRCDINPLYKRGPPKGRWVGCHAVTQQRQETPQSTLCARPLLLLRWGHDENVLQRRWFVPAT